MEQKGYNKLHNNNWEMYCNYTNDETFALSCGFKKNINKDTFYNVKVGLGNIMFEYHNKDYFTRFFDTYNINFYICLILL